MFNIFTTTVFNQIRNFCPPPKPPEPPESILKIQRLFPWDIQFVMRSMAHYVQAFGYNLRCHSIHKIHRMTHQKTPNQLLIEKNLPNVRHIHHCNCMNISGGISCGIDRDNWLSKVSVNEGDASHAIDLDLGTRYSYQTKLIYKPNQSKIITLKNLAAIFFYLFLNLVQFTRKCSIVEFIYFFISKFNFCKKLYLKTQIFPIKVYTYNRINFKYIHQLEVV
jgi:hypothetical protein